MSIIFANGANASSSQKTKYKTSASFPLNPKPDNNIPEQQNTENEESEQQNTENIKSEQKEIEEIDKKSIIRLVRKWVYWSGYNATSSTTGAFTIDDDNLTGYFLEPYGESTAESGKDKRIPTGIYSMVWHSSGKYTHNPKIYNSQVPQSRAILIHVGNYGSNTEGCLLPGSGLMSTNKKVTGVSNSKVMYDKLIKYIESKGIENVKLIITEKFEDENI
jgi:hypothetical protein